MRVYELCLIVHADATDEGLQTIVSTIETVIAKNKGSLLNVEQWGKKNFKYSIKKQTKGHYCFITFNGDSTVLREIDRAIRYNEQIVRYDTILLPKGPAAAPSPSQREMPKPDSAEAAKQVATPSDTGSSEVHAEQ